MKDEKNRPGFSFIPPPSSLPAPGSQQMMPVISCPSVKQLEQLLSGALDQQQIETLSSHVQVCLHCQKALGLLSEHESMRDWISSCPSWRSESHSVPNLNEFLSRLRQELRPSLRHALAALESSPAHEAAQNDWLSFLKPAIYEGDLGALGRHRILAELGRGGMGVVFMGYDPELARTVAIKVLSSDRADARSKARFVREAQALAGLEHDHIVPIYAVEKTGDGLPYLVMQYVDGPTIRKRIHDEGRILPREAAEIALQVADGLASAHRLGLIHRDIKPANIMWDTAQGRAKIVDFGLVRVHESARDVTQEGAVPGTPEYMSPEQVLQPLSVDCRSDIYALGVTLYEMLTGVAPFRGAPLAVLQQIVHDDPVLPRRSISSIPRDLDTICLKSLAKKPRDRYQTALELADDLRRFLNHEPILARSIGPLARIWRWSRRQPALAALVAVIILSGLIITIGSFVAALRLQESAQERLWQARFAEARAHRLSNQAGRQYLALEELAQANRIRPAPELRDEAIAALALFDLQPVKTWTTQAPEGSLLGFDDNLRSYAQLDGQGHIRVRSTEAAVDLARLPANSPKPRFGLSPDGRFLVVGDAADNALKIWDLRSGNATPLIEERATTLAFRSDSNQLLAAHPDDTVRLYDLPSGRTVKDYPATVTPAHMAFHAKRSDWAVAHEKGVQLRDLKTGQVIATFDQQNGVDWLAWHPDGTILAAAGETAIYLWNTATRQPIHVLRGSKRGGNLAWFNHQGDLLLTNGWDGRLRIWDHRTGKQIFETPAARILPRLSSDDRFLPIVRDNQWQLMEVQRNESHRTLIRDWPNPVHHYFCPAISPAGSARGRLLATASEDGVTFWDLAAGREISTLRIGPTYSLAFEASGAMWTNGPSGVRRWPALEEIPGTVGFSPPQLLLSKGNTNQIACSADGQVAAIPQQNGALVIRRGTNQESRNIILTGHEDVRYVAVSGNGRWVATGSHNARQVKIWDAQNGACLKELPIGGSGVSFLPGDRCLFTSGDGGRLWAVDSWDPGNDRYVTRPTASYVNYVNYAFSPDGTLLAEGTGDGVIRIMDVAANRELAKLQDPDQDNAEFLAFSPDGTRLVTVASGLQTLHVWDLQVLDRKLREAGLQWEVPVATRPLESQSVPFRVTVHLEHEERETRDQGRASSGGG
jgi:eukaryotic-like serine/threonine-protein kinase